MQKGTWSWQERENQLGFAVVWGRLPQCNAALLLTDAFLM